MFTPPQQQAPTSYESHLETPEGIHVAITYHTDNKAMADRYADELIQKSGWKVFEKAPEKPMGKVAGVFVAWALALVVGIILPAMLFIGTSILHSARYVDRSVSDYFWDNGARIGIWAFVITGIVITALVLLERPSTADNNAA